MIEGAVARRAIPWLSVLAAILLTLVMLVVDKGEMFGYSVAPLTVLIIVAAYYGGLFPGLSVVVLCHIFKLHAYSEAKYENYLLLAVNLSILAFISYVRMLSWKLEEEEEEYKKQVYSETANKLDNIDGLIREVLVKLDELQVDSETIKKLDYARSKIVDLHHFALNWRVLGSDRFWTYRGKDIFS